MKVLQLALGYPPTAGGLEQVAFQLTTGLEARGHEVSVVCFDDYEPGPGQPGPPQVVRNHLRAALAERRPAAVLAARRHLAEHVSETAPDVVICHFGEGATLLALREVPRSVPRVVVLHNVLLSHLDTTPSSLLVTSTEGATFVAVSESVAESFSHACGTVRVITNGISGGRVQPEPSGPPVLMCLGRLVEQKGFDVAIRAMAQVRGAHPDARLLIVGDGPESAALRDLAHRYGPGIELVGPIPAGSAVDHLAGAHLILMPSRFEGHPIVALEAAWAGRAVVGTAARGLVDAVQHERTGLLVPVDDVGALAAAVIALLDDPAHRQRLASAARHHAQAHCSSDEMVDRYLALIESMLACGR